MFWKKKAKNTNDKNKLSGKPEYVVTVYDKLGKSAREVSTFVCEQDRSPDDGLLYLQTSDQEFMALFPSRKNVVRNNKTVQQLKSEIEKIKNKPQKETDNPLSLKSEIYKLEQQLYFLEHPSAEFIAFDSDGMPHIRFLRVNSNFVPLVWDIDLNSIYIPAEPNLKDSLTSMLDKKEKYKLKKDKLKGILEVAMWIIILLFICGNAYWTYHNWAYADSESSLAKIQERIDASQIVCNDALAITTQTNVQTAQITKENAETTKSILDSVVGSMTSKPSNAVAVETIK